MQKPSKIFTPLNILAALVGLAVLYGIFFRSYNLSYPAKQVFDEVYFPVFANNYLHGQTFYDVHPPLGKFIIAVGIFLFGDNGFGWRIMPLLFGIGNIFLMGYLAWLLFKDKAIALMTVFFIAIDGMFIVYSRTGLMDGILFFATFVCMVTAARIHKKGSTLMCGVALGLAVAIKWPAVAIFLPMMWYAYQTGNLRRLWDSLPIAVVVYLAIVIAGQVIIKTPNPVLNALLWHQEAFEYHAHVTATHPWGSQWWSWPLQLRPVLFLYDTLPDGKVQIENNMGNIVAWVASTLAAGGSLLYLIGLYVRTKVKPWTHELFPLLVGYLALWLPWALIHRVVFLYHYMPAYGFALLMLAYWLGKAWKRGFQFAVLIFLVICFFFAVRYLPFAVGWIAQTEPQFQKLILIKSWLY